MWHWQYKNERLRIIFWTKLIGISAVGHLMLLIMLFFGYHRYEVFHIELNNTLIPSDVPVVFLPLYKQVPVVVKKDTVQSKKKSTPVKQPLLEKKSVVSPAVVQKQKPVQPAVQPKKNAPKKPAVALACATAEIKKDPKKTTAKPVQPKIVHNKQSPPIKKIEQSPVKQELAMVQKTAAITTELEQEVVYIGQEEKFARELQRILEKEIVARWIMPTGLPKDTLCQVAVEVDRQGTVEVARIEKSSGICIYDISARNAAMHMKLPKMAWGKEFIITFKQ